MVSDVNITNILGQQQNTANAASGLAEDFSQFLTLLTVQLQNQDPLSPMDTTEFTNQLVAFTGVEQQINTNQKLDSLVSLELGNSFSVAQGYVGLDVSYISSELAFDGSKPVEVTYALNGDAAISKINVRDESGDVVYSQDAAKFGGPHSFKWDGTLDTDGDGQNDGRAPAGTYTVTIDALDIEGNAVTGTTVVRGNVRGVETQNGQIFLLVGERAVPLSSILNTDTPNGNLTNNAALTTALSYIGMDIKYANSKFDFDGSTDLDVEYNLQSDADRARFLVFDNATGETIFSDDLVAIEGRDTPFGEIMEAGNYSYTWNGLLNNNTIAEPGTYTIAISALDVNDNPVSTSTFSESRVTGVETDNGELFLETAGGIISLSNVVSISQPEAEEPEA